MAASSEFRQQMILRLQTLWRLIRLAQILRGHASLLQICFKLDIFNDILSDSFCIFCEGQCRDWLSDAKIWGTQTYDKMCERIASKTIFENVCQLGVSVRYVLQRGWLVLVDWLALSHSTSAPIQVGERTRRFHSTVERGSSIHPLWYWWYVQIWLTCLIHLLCLGS